MRRNYLLENVSKRRLRKMSMRTGMGLGMVNAIAAVLRSWWV